MHDNGAAMRALELLEGGLRLGIVQAPTLAYSPYQNGKQETFWETVEGRLMAMLQRKEPLSLAFLNQATAAWVELDYNRAIHSELGTSPLERMLAGPDVSRPAPDLTTLRFRFTRQQRRTQRKGDGTISIKGVRFELPSRLRFCEHVTVRFQSWDRSVAFVVDERSDAVLARIFPIDKERNASGHRRALEPEGGPAVTSGDLEGLDPLPPLMRKLLQDHAATGLPPAYLPKDELATRTDPEDGGES